MEHSLFQGNYIHTLMAFYTRRAVSLLRGFDLCFMLHKAEKQHTVLPLYCLKRVILPSESMCVGFNVCTHMHSIICTDTMKPGVDFKAMKIENCVTFSFEIKQPLKMQIHQLYQKA